LAPDLFDEPYLHDFRPLPPRLRLRIYRGSVIYTFTRAEGSGFHSEVESGKVEHGRRLGSGLKEIRANGRILKQ
jgi:hypothetical protein